MQIRSLKKSALIIKMPDGWMDRRHFAIQENEGQTLALADVISGLTAMCA
jgi:hypothetical protein